MNVENLLQSACWTKHVKIVDPFQDKKYQFMTRQDADKTISEAVQLCFFLRWESY